MNRMEGWCEESILCIVDVCEDRVEWRVIVNTISIRGSLSGRIYSIWSAQLIVGKVTDKI